MHMEKDMIHIANCTLEQITFTFDDDQELHLGVAGRDNDNGIVSLEDNGFFEAYEDIFQDAISAGAIMIVTNEEAETIKAHSMEVKAMSETGNKPRMVRADAPEKPKLITREQAISQEPKGNKAKNLEHYRKELEGLGSDLTIDTNKLRIG